MIPKSKEINYQSTVCRCNSHLGREVKSTYVRKEDSKEETNNKENKYNEKNFDTFKNNNYQVNLNEWYELNYF